MEKIEWILYDIILTESHLCYVRLKTIPSSPACVHAGFVHAFHLQHNYVLFSVTDPQVYSHSRILMKNFILHISNTRSFTLLAKANGLNICSEAGKKSLYSLMTTYWVLSKILGAFFRNYFTLRRQKCQEKEGENIQAQCTFLNEFCA